MEGTTLYPSLKNRTLALFSREPERTMHCANSTCRSTYSTAFYIPSPFFSCHRYPAGRLSSTKEEDGRKEHHSTNNKQRKHQYVFTEHSGSAPHLHAKRALGRREPLKPIHNLQQRNGHGSRRRRLPLHRRRVRRPARHRNIHAPAPRPRPPHPHPPPPPNHTLSFPPP